MTSTAQRDQATILESLVSESKCPEDDDLRRLDECRIDWHLTDEGNLMIKSWQVAAEGFVPAARVAELRADRPPPNRADELEWVSRNLAQLEADHGGEWVAVENGQIVASASDLPALIQALDGAVFDSPFVTQIPSSPVVWHTLYDIQEV